MTMTPQTALATLRAQAGVAPADMALAPLFEHWLKRDQWHARTEALALAVGVEPARWATLRMAPAANAAADALWRSLAEDLGCGEAADPAIAPRELDTWARRHALALPDALARLLEFIGRVLPAALPDRGGHDPALADDRATILGAALALATRRPHACLDAEGYWDGAAIARQIFRQAVYWFPLGPPALPEPEAAELIGRYLPTRSETTDFS